MTIPHFGKREAGGLTAAAPGDTLHFAFQAFNDSGNSEALTGFAVGDIEVFKNGLPTTRATARPRVPVATRVAMGAELENVVACKVRYRFIFPKSVKEGVDGRNP